MHGMMKLLTQDKQVLTSKVDDTTTVSTTARMAARAMRTAQIDEMLSDANKMALATETTADDDFVGRKLPKILEEEVHNDASGDDFYPGSHVLNKYQ